MKKNKITLFACSIILTISGCQSTLETIDQSSGSRHANKSDGLIDGAQNDGLFADDDELDLPPTKDVVVNREPKWYWDEAWQRDNAGPQVLPDEKKREIIEWSFRFLLRNGDDEISHRFVGILDGQTPSGYTDPDVGTIKKLRKAGHIIKPCSKARFPRRNETLPGKPNKYRGIEDPVTGEEAWLYYVRIVEVFPQNMVVVELGSYSGPLSGGGCRVMLQKRDKEWKILWRLKQWVR